MFFQIGDPGDPQSNTGNNNPELSLQYRLRSGVPYKRAQISPDSTSGIDIKDYNSNSRINLKADTINISGEEDMSSYSGGTMWYSNHPAKVFVHGNMNIYDTAELNNLKVGNYFFPTYGPPSQINGSYDGYQLITDLELQHAAQQPVPPRRPAPAQGRLEGAARALRRRRRGWRDQARRRRRRR